MKKEIKRLKRVISDLERDITLQEGLLKGNVLYLDNYDSKEEFRVIKTNEALQKIKETNEKNSHKIFEQEKYIYSLERKLRDTEEFVEKNIEQKRVLYVLLLLSTLWSVFVTASSHFLK